MSWRRLGLGLLLAAGLAPAAHADTPSDFLKAVGTAIDIQPEQVADLRAGKIVAKHVRKEARRELSLSVAMLVDAPPERSFAAVRKDEVVEIDGTILAHGDLPAGPVDASAFASLDLPASELDSLLDDGRQDDWNLSAEEGARFQTVAKQTHGRPAAERRAAVLDAVREMLAARLEAYRSRGLSGLPAYTRENGDSIAIADDLKRANASLEGFHPYAPAFLEALDAAPSAPAAAAVSPLYQWRLQQIHGRPTLALTHRGVWQGEGHSLAFVRQIYVAHTFDTLQVVTAVFAFEGKSLAVYTNRTYTEQVAGFGSAAAHRIGRGIMEGEVRTLFESVRKALEADVAAGK